MPTYVLHGEDDRQNFVENAYKLRDALTCEKVVEIVPKESSGSAHCQMDDFTKTFNMFDWIAKKMNGTMLLLLSSGKKKQSLNKYKPTKYLS